MTDLHIFGMLFKNRFLDGIKDGSITIAFRNWRKSSVKEGGTLQTPGGLLEIIKIEKYSISKIKKAEIIKAGYGSIEDLQKDLYSKIPGELYKIEFRLLGADPRIKLRENTFSSDQEYEELHELLRSWDKRSKHGEWTIPLLKLIRKFPAMKAGDLSLKIGIEKEELKLLVRKLKNKGLTESLGTGYRISPRGESFLKKVKQ
ncbi:hypothetical protein [Leptospira sarikeiensis]|uniref:ASCH domain-containing protein n=1 Tax=Leptospira sarikeiensis TaxID=2484943 RepID=A0A4R9K4F2_9LEPT|nr:hypothetical protein [Leptospira sarikeiensis]TGL60999.1 hypothetical protein EHQ64_14480 [Leptospira sarikeiensis]